MSDDTKRDISTGALPDEPSIAALEADYMANFSKFHDRGLDKLADDIADSGADAE